ncbi:ParB/RepB/Spo0J family partition protein [Paenibacillus sp. DMB20]|uniref:ParB/RepB/Spo0J family partition protein n=1 Tax=Paenibacillus sp. DMB20 TaxID=1642570 RepID=UPI00069B1ACA|nr:ParB/RepB/Spo0J family partition protein [Paenibacillus sp. DMB20]
MTKELILESIVVNPDQPRKHFDEESLRQLAESIKADGLQSPILVRPKAGNFEIVQGERRYRAHVIAGLGTIRADVRELSDEDAFHLAVIENIQREQLTEMEEARAFQRYVELGLTHDAIAKKSQQESDLRDDEIKVAKANSRGAGPNCRRSYIERPRRSDTQNRGLN